MAKNCLHNWVFDKTRDMWVCTKCPAFITKALLKILNYGKQEKRIY